MSLLAEIQSYLAGAGLGLTPSTNLFASYLPDSPDPVVAIYEYAGPAPIDTMGVQSGHAAYWRPRLQVVCRDVNYLPARTLAANVLVSLHKIANQSVGGVQYLRISALQDPFQRGKDQRQRSEIVCNYQVIKAFS